MSLINKIHTSCKNCVFAKYKDITQDDCALDYISKFRLKNVEILEAYDEEKEFYIINNKKCLGYRENKWFNQFGLEHSSLDKKIEKFQEFNHLSYLLVVDLKYFDDKSFFELQQQINDCVIKPEKIIFIRYQWINNFHFNKIKQMFDNAKIDCKWRIQTMVDESMNTQDILHNIVNSNKSYRFIASINKPNKDLTIIVDRANAIVYNNLDYFTAIKNIDSSIILFSAPSYRWSVAVEQKNILDYEDNYIII